MRFKWEIDPADRRAVLEYRGANYEIWRPDPQGEYRFADMTTIGGIEGRAASYPEAIAAIERYIAGQEVQRKRVFSNPDAPWRSAPMTDRQKEILNKFRISYSDTTTKGEASELIDAAFNRRKRA